MSYKPETDSMVYGGYLSTSQTLPQGQTPVQWRASDIQLDFDTSLKSCNSVSGAIIPNYPKSCAFADVSCSYANGYYVFTYCFSGGFRKDNALLGRNQQQRNDVVFDILTTTARVHASETYVSSGSSRILDPEGLNQLVGFFI